MLASIGGGAVGPWLTGALHDATGNYTAAFCIALVCSLLSAIAIWFAAPRKVRLRSEEHTSELQSQFHLVCRLLLEKKKNTLAITPFTTCGSILITEPINNPHALTPFEYNFCGIV